MIAIVWSIVVLWRCGVVLGHGCHVRQKCVRMLPVVINGGLGGDILSGFWLLIGSYLDWFFNHSLLTIDAA